MTVNVAGKLETDLYRLLQLRSMIATRSIGHSTSKLQLWLIYHDLPIYPFKCCFSIVSLPEGTVPNVLPLSPAGAGEERNTAAPNRACAPCGCGQVAGPSAKTMGC